MDYRDYIIPYLNGNLEGETLSGFEKHLRENPDFSEEVHFQKDVMDSLVYMKENESLRALSKQIRARDDQREKVRRIAPIGALSLAAAVAIFFLVFSSNLGNQAYEEDFTAYFQPTEMNQVVLQSEELVSAGDETPLKTFEKGKELYAQEQYKEAISTFNQVIATGNYIDQATLYQGVAYLALGKTRKAIRKFDEIVEYPLHATWYKGLANLEIGKADQTEILMKNLLEMEADLPASEQIYSARAADILERLSE